MSDRAEAILAAFQRRGLVDRMADLVQRLGGGHWSLAEDDDGTVTLAVNAELVDADISITPAQLDEARSVDDLATAAVDVLHEHAERLTSSPPVRPVDISELAEANLDLAIVAIRDASPGRLVVGNDDGMDAHDTIVLDAIILRPAQPFGGQAGPATIAITREVLVAIVANCIGFALDPARHHEPGEETPEP